MKILKIRVFIRRWMNCNGIIIIIVIYGADKLHMDRRRESERET